MHQELVGAGLDGVEVNVPAQVRSVLHASRAEHTLDRVSSEGAGGRIPDRVTRVLGDSARVTS